MSGVLLKNTRRLNSLLQESGPDRILFPELADVLSEILRCNVFIASRKGRILASSLELSQSIQPLVEGKHDDKYFDDEYYEKLLSINGTNANTRAVEMYDRYSGIEADDLYLTIVPISCGGDRMGTLIFEYRDMEFLDNDLVLAEYSATVVGMEIMRSKSDEYEEESRKKAVVQMAIATLSYSELEAVQHVFNELNGSEGLLVASKIADRVGITRSVIVNALRKFESAGVIESRSLGMKGTHIKILNEKLIPELEKSK